MLAGAFVTSCVAGLLIASSESTKKIIGEAPIALTALRVASGPLVGWVEGVIAGNVLTALWFLLPGTLFIGWLLGIWFMTRSWLALGATTLVWIAMGYFFAIAIYV